MQKYSRQLEGAGKGQRRENTEGWRRMQTSADDLIKVVYSRIHATV